MRKCEDLAAPVDLDLVEHQHAGRGESVQQQALRQQREHDRIGQGTGGPRQHVALFCYSVRAVANFGSRLF